MVHHVVEDHVVAPLALIGFPMRSFRSKAVSSKSARRVSTMSTRALDRRFYWFMALLCGPSCVARSSTSCETPFVASPWTFPVSASRKPHCFADKRFRETPIGLRHS